MPIDLVVTFKDGAKELFYIPMNEMMGNKPSEDKSIKQTDYTAWPWVNPTYEVIIKRKLTEIESIEIDPSLRMADIDRKNNKVVVSELVLLNETH